MLLDREPGAARYAVGLYLVGLLPVVPLAAYAVLGLAPSPRGLTARAVAAAAGFALVYLLSAAFLLDTAWSTTPGHGRLR